MSDRSSRLRFLRTPLIGGFVLSVLVISGCSDGPPTQGQARDSAAGAVCDYYARCMDIGAPPATFTSRQDCLITWKSNIDGLWPPAQCTTIVQTGFDVCIAAIRNQACGNPGDFLNTVTNCSEANVCGPP